MAVCDVYGQPAMLVAQSLLLPALQARLLQLYGATEDWRRQRVDEQLVLAINRSDYMLDEPSSTLLQVVITTISGIFLYWRTSPHEACLNQCKARQEWPQHFC